MHLFSKMPLPTHFVDAMYTSWLEGKDELKIGAKDANFGWFFMSSVSLQYCMIIE